MKSLELQPPGCSMGSVSRTLPTTDTLQRGLSTRVSGWREGIERAEDGC